MNLEFENRQNVPTNLKADLKSIYENTQKWEEDFKWVSENLHALDRYQNHILDSSKNLEEVLKKSDEIEQHLEKLYVYAMFSKDCDITDASAIKMYDKIVNLNVEYSTITSFIMPELLQANIETVTDYIKENSALEQYRFSLEKIYRYKKHSLSANEEAIISSFTPSLISFENISELLNNSEIKYGSIKVDGKLKEITSTNGLFFATHKNRQVRKKASLQKMQKLNEFGNTFATSLVSSLKAVDTEAKLRGYENAFKQALYADNVDESLYNNLLNFISNHLDLYKKWYKIIKKVLGVKTLHQYDLNAPLIKEYDKKYSPQEAEIMIKDALQILGDEYSKVLTKVFDEHWIDYAVYKGKVNRWYQINAYNTHPLIYANYLGKLENVSSLAHEIGHAIHSYLSDQNNSYNNSQYTIFVAEVASLTNEILLNKYLIEHSLDNNEKLNCIHNLIEMITSNFYDASLQATFEKELNVKISNKEALTKDDLNNLWQSIQSKYYAPVVVFDDVCSINWCRIPHFYSPFYTYKYSIGISCACYVAMNILNNTAGFKEKYLSFLKSGNTDYPVNQLKKLGIDLNKEEAFIPTIDLLNELMDNFIKIYKEVNNEQ